ncbi:hypothetical protein FC15_GL000570 [Lapidilactobacillus concavus DSM 17758]|uniref:Uncharacterized protein n=1 Tax=Lapidilactobacillus concavus DSM 17758 TaxID=1423735 RepID=A0A0R1W044_9LACO|nr:tetratricopeptide repeat protein [Lapidilactobacillus concavus]KRM08502.1 hypothetical protein FC15_GL000570 [Lapidilactobacillus concavus DSM 17758]GEL13043.1 hypothetical protein LCO01nite_05920 [Lapidilactobacillus concavus]
MKQAPQPKINEKIMAQFKAGQREEAIIALTKLLAQQPNDVDLLLQLATMLIEVTDLTQAQQVLQRAAVIDPERVEVLYNQAVVAHQLKQDQQAVQWLQKLSRSALAVEANYLLAVIYFEHQQIQLAAAFALTAVEAEPSDFPANLLLAQILAKQQAWTQCLGYAQQANMLEPDDADAMFVYGSALLNTGDVTRGRQLLQRVAAVAPKKYESAVSLILSE